MSVIIFSSRDVNRNKLYDAKEMAQLYNELPNQWLLLEIKKKDKAGRAEKLLLLKNDPDKNRLYDYLMEEDINWDWNKNYIFVYSDPDKACDLI